MVLKRSTRPVDVERRLTAAPLISDYIQIRSPVYISHSAGRYAIKRFRKAQCPIIERLTNSLMMNGRNNGKKLMAVRIVAHSFEIVRPFISSFELPVPTRIRRLIRIDPHHDRSEPHPSRRRRNRQLRPPRGLHTYWVSRHGSTASRRRFPSPPRQPGHCTAHHWRAGVCVPEREECGGMFGGRADQCGQR